MKIELLNQEKETATFLIKDTNPTEINSLRRTIIDEVPTLAIEDINFIKNNSALYDEIIAHRLGLIVLKTDLKSYNLPSECKGKKKGEKVCTKENCPHHSVLMTLKANGPKTVYAEELDIKDKKVTPAYPKTPIAILLKKQSLEFEATAIMGQGKDHMKFSPGLAYYRGKPSIKIGAVKNPEAIMEVCPQNVYEINNKKLKVTDENKCILCKACVDASENNIDVNGSDKEFIFTLESWGQLEHQEILLKALDIMDSKINEFSKLIKKI